MVGWWLGIGSAVALLWVFWRVGRGARRDHAEAIRHFRQQREHLEAAFFAAAARSGKPRGLRWKGCEWSDLLEFALDRRSGRLTAVAGVTLSFEAVEGGDMEGVAAVGNLRNASAVFVHDGRRWSATDRVVFNLNPAEVLSHFPTQFERLSAPAPPAADTR